MPMTSTNHPNPFFKLLADTFLPREFPIKIPTIASAVTESNSCQSMVCFPRSPVNPNSDFAAIINKEVPTACFIGSLLKMTKAGMIKNQPPAPTRPVNKPTMVPSSKIMG